MNPRPNNPNQEFNPFSYDPRTKPKQLRQQLEKRDERRERVEMGRKRIPTKEQRPNKVTRSKVLQKEPKTRNRTSIRQGIRPHIQITRLTSRTTKKKNPNSTPHRNRFDRWVEIKQNGLPLRVVKAATLTRQQTSSLINSKLSRHFKNKNTKKEKKYTKIEKNARRETTPSRPPSNGDDASRIARRRGS
ncbi:hypothetical protein R6Q57_030101 [Mikania cordata]